MERQVVFFVTFGITFGMMILARGVADLISRNGLSCVLTAASGCVGVV